MRLFFCSFIFCIFVFLRGSADPLQKVTFATGYIPNVQFAPFYIAIEKGFFKEEGLEVTLDYAMGAEPLKLIAAEKFEFGSADGDALIAAVSRGIPLQGVFLLYQQSPVSLYALKSKIENISDIKGKKIGIPGLFGAAYIGWQLASQAEPIFKTTKLVPIGYTQVQSVLSQRVDAALGFENNEPLALKKRGIEVNVWPLRNYAWMPGSSIVVANNFAKKNKKTVKAFLKAVQKGIEEVVSHPARSFHAIQPKYLPELKGKVLDEQLEVLKATIPLWKTASPAMKLGSYQFAKLDKAIDGMISAKFISKKVSAESVFSNDFLP